MWTRPNSMSSEKANVHPMVNKQPSTLVDDPAKSSVNGMSKSKSIELTANVKAHAVKFPFEKSIAAPRTNDTSTAPSRFSIGPAPVNNYPFANALSKRPTIKPTFEVEAREPAFEFPFEKAIIVPRTIGTISMHTRLLNEPVPAFKYPLTKSVVETGAKSKWIKPSIESQAPAPIIKFPFEKSIVDSRTAGRVTMPTNFLNRPAPAMKYPSANSIVDTRLKNKSIKPSIKSQAPAPIIKFAFEKSIVDPRTADKITIPTNFLNRPAPAIKYPYANSIVDTRSKSQSIDSTTEVEAPEAEINFPFERSIVDPRTFDQSMLLTNSRYVSPLPLTYPMSILAQTYGYRSMLKDYLMKLSGIINFNHLHGPMLI